VVQCSLRGSDVPEPGATHRHAGQDRAPPTELLLGVVFDLALIGLTAVLGMLALPLLLAPRKASMAFGRVWSRAAILLLRHIVGCDYEVRGRERLPRGGCIIAMKHQSAWDALVVPVLFDDPAPVVKRELLRLPIYGWYLRRAGAIAIDRGAGASALRRMVAEARAAAAAERPIVIFPQGTRVAPGAHSPYQPGVAAIYRALALPIVPAAVNSGIFWGRRAFRKRPGRIVLEFLDPVPPGWPRQRLMAELETRIEPATAALEREARAAEPRPLPAVQPHRAAN
jgi:1-acyl-sn-glycerol-3-phosphate acyltransferase